MNIKELICGKAKELGILKFGAAKADKLDLDKELYLNSEFAYLRNNADFLENPCLLLENARTILTFAFNYYYPIERKKDFPIISRYALGSDYHIVIKQKMNELIDYIKSIEPNFQYFLSVDGSKIPEKVWAERCSIGWQGKHSLLITKEAGSWVCLAVLVTNLDIEPDLPHKNLCGNCRKCIEACPTNAIYESGGINARKCISYNNIESRKETYINSFHGYLYGCDICQENCPYNKSPETSEIKEFQPNSELLNIDYEQINTMTNTEFNELFANSAIKRVKLKTIQRNAEILLNNLH